MYMYMYIDKQMKTCTYMYMCVSNSAWALIRVGLTHLSLHFPQPPSTITFLLHYYQLTLLQRQMIRFTTIPDVFDSHCGSA